jgi:uncharacterized membrane protein YcaP (DUF421 family)
MLHFVHIFLPEISVLEKIFRSVVIYFFVLIAFRFSGKREVGQLTPFDLVVLLIISNVVQNAVIGPDNSLGGGIIGASTIFILNFFVVKLAYRSKRARQFLEPTPTLLIHNGKILHENLKKETITMEDLHAALRKNGLINPDEVRFAVLEDNGQISVVPRSQADHR